MAKKLELALLGKIKIRINSIPLTDLKSKKSKALLCYLAVTGQPQTRSFLAGLLWGGMSEKNARMNLSQALSTLRRFFPDQLRTTRETIVLDKDSDCWLDVAEFKNSRSKASEESGVTVLEDAIQLYRGEFMEDLYLPDASVFEDWALAERAILREEALNVLELLMLNFSKQNLHEKTIDFAQRLQKIDPWHEMAQYELMRSLALSGRRSAALLQYKRYHQMLNDDLGIEPANEITKLSKLIQENNFPSAVGTQTLSAQGKEYHSIETATLKQNLHTSMPPNNLPPKLTDFIGREREAKELENLILNHGARLVSLVGAGGIGKTRLALEFAQRQLWKISRNDEQDPVAVQEFTDGIYFVSLESLESSDLIAPAIAESIHFRLDRGEDQLIDYLRTKRLLLILDNYEHLIDGVDTLSCILKSAPYVHILVTSRERLKLQGEQVFPLYGLAYPESDNHINPLEYSAVKFFLQAAQRLRPDYSLNDSEMPHLIDLCRLVEGMPLALELAAAWTDTLPVSEIRKEIHRNIDFLAVDFPDSPRRHRSMRAAIETSWERLKLEDQNYFSQLSVFKGGFTREAASKITGASIHALSNLVEKSLLRYSKSQDRYYLHESLRQFGGEKLSERNEYADKLMDLHSQYYCQWFAEQVTPKILTSVGQKAVLDALKIELENARAAWIWALQHGRIDRLIGRTSAIGLYYIWRGGFQEGEKTFRSFLSSLGIDDSTDTHGSLIKVCLLNWQAFFVYQIGEQGQIGLELLQLSTRLINSPIPSRGELKEELGRNMIIIARWDQSQTIDTRLELAVKASSLFRDAEDPFGLAYALASSARLAILCGRLDDAEKYLKESREVCEQAGDQLGRTFALIGLGNLAFAQNDYEGSIRLMSASLHIAEEMGNIERKIVALLYMGVAEIHSGRFTEAQGILEWCVKNTENQGLKAWQATCLYYLGISLLHQAEYDRAVNCCEVALPLAEQTHDMEIASLCTQLPAAIYLVYGEYEKVLQVFKEASILSGLFRIIWILGGEDPGQVVSGMALLELGRIKEAQKIFTSLLQQAVSAHRLDQLLYAVVGIASFFARKGDAERAFELYTLASSYPFVGNSCWFTDVFGQYIQKVGKTSPNMIRENGGNQQFRHELWETAEALLVEFGCI